MIKEKWQKVKNWYQDRKQKKKDVDVQLARIAERSMKVDPGSEEYKALRVAYTEELKNKKLVQSLRLGGVPWINILYCIGLLLFYGLGVILDLDSPKAVRFSERMISMWKTKISKDE